MGYHFSTAREICNLALEATGLIPIATDAAYTDRQQLDKYQRQATIFLYLVQLEFGVIFNKRFMWREWSFATKAEIEDYKIPGQIVEGFKANSFFNVTFNGTANGPLNVVPYEHWRRAEPNPEYRGTGSPRYLVLLPEDGTPDTRLKVWPRPNDVYRIYGMSRLLVPAITHGAQPVVVPQLYEHALVWRLCELLESRLNEGRDLSAKVLAEQTVAEVMRDASGAYEEQEPIEPGIRLYRRVPGESKRSYNPATDTVPQFPT